MKHITIPLALIVAVTLLSPPIIAEAQQPGKLLKIGMLVVPKFPTNRPPAPGSVRDRLRELGYIEGQHYALEWRVADGDYARLPELAADLVRARVDLIIAMGNAGAQAALGATESIPIVSVSCDSFTLVTSLARHERNVTGVTCMRMELTGKRFEIFKEAVPKTGRVALLYNPIEGPEGLQLAETAARQLGLALLPVPVRHAKDVEAALDSVRQQRPDALVVNPDAILVSRTRQIADFALKHRLPAIHPFSEFADAGGLMSYGSSSRDLNTRAAALIDKILKGAKPTDLPVEQATRFYLTINMKTARALGVTIPPSVLVRADRVIE